MWVTPMKLWQAIKKSLSPVPSGSGWRNLISESFAGAWQLNTEVSTTTALAHHAVFSCISLITNDIGKLRPRVMRVQNGVRQEVATDESVVLRKPNPYQNFLQFQAYWIGSKLTYGNTYTLKERDARGRVVALRVLNPVSVTPLVADDGSVFYQLGDSKLEQIFGQLTVPASEILHDRWNCIDHPLVGTSPLFAAGAAARHGLRMQEGSSEFWANGARPSGILTAPGSIPQAVAERLRSDWNEKFTGQNSGKLAVLGDGLTYEALTAKAVDAQLIEQMRWSAQQVAGIFHVPLYKLGLESLPAGRNSEDVNLMYYTDALQALIEAYELLVTECFGFDGVTEEVALDLAALMRMDRPSTMAMLATGVGSAIYSPNEARALVDMPPVEGGETPYLQQQNYSLAALAKRDSMEAEQEPAEQEPAEKEPAEQEPAEQEPAEKSLPVIVDAGVWAHKAYNRGAAVTHGGSLWIAQRDTDAKPGTDDSGWRLAVKRGSIKA